ncbi:Cys-tRNA(Pro) deacylase, partial [Mycobacterium tuberculosis]|nr:Cys-tRNA(Pro) deacylase [Mycobacterium tuberculosis]
MTVASKPASAATPAVRVLNLAGIDYSLHSFDHDPATRRYGSEAADKLGVGSDQVFKTLMIQVDGSPVTALVPVSGQLDLKALASARGAK